MFSFVYKGIDFAHKLDKPSSPTEEYFKHIHPFCEIIYFVCGKVDYTVESETCSLGEGDIVFIAPGKYHYATVDLSVPYERYVFKFSETVLPDFLIDKLKKEPAFYCNSKKYGMIFNQFDSWSQKYSKDEMYAMSLCETIKLLIMLCETPPASGNKKHSEFIDGLVNYIDCNIENKITIQSLTEEFHYSKSFINIEFKRHMKIPIMQYIRQKKIIAAHRMIISGAKKSEVSEMFGFEDYSTFYRTYKKFLEQGLLPDGID